MRAFATLILLAAAPHGIAAPDAFSVIYAEDFESGMGSWTGPQFVGTTEGCLGAASGDHSLQIADCGDFVPLTTSITGSSWIMGARAPVEGDRTMEIAFAARGATLYVGQAQIVLTASCRTSSHGLGSWTVGGTPFAELGLVTSSAPTEWTSYQRTFECDGPELRLHLVVDHATGSPPAQELFALDAIVVRAS